MTVNVIQLIITKLEQYPSLSCQVEESKITVKPAHDQGFTVSLTIDDSGFVVHYDGWHETFTGEAEALDCFIFGLCRKGRLKVHKKGNSEYKWTLQHKTEQDWEDDSTTGLFFYPFWAKEEIIYKQNNLEI